VGSSRLNSRDVLDWDESDVRVRPNKRGSRPRTKDRPAHKSAIRGRVITVDRGRWSVVVAEGTVNERTLVATRARELRRTALGHRRARAQPGGASPRRLPLKSRASPPSPSTPSRSTASQAASLAAGLSAVLRGEVTGMLGSDGRGPIRGSIVQICHKGPDPVGVREENR